MFDPSRVRSGQPPQGVEIGYIEGERVIFQSILGLGLPTADPT